MLKGQSTFRVGIVCAFLAAILFGTISTIAKPTLASINPILLSSFIYLIAATTMTGASGIRLPSLNKKYYLFILASGISGGVLAPILYFSGLTHTSASDASIISNSEILFTILFAILFFKERLHRLGYFFMSFVVVGIFMITANPESSKSIDLNVGNIFILLSAIFWGIDNNINRILTKVFTNSAKIAQLKSLIGGITLICLVLLLRIPFNVDISQIPSIIILGVGGFAGSLYFFLIALKRIGTVKTTLVFSLFSPTGLVASWLFLQETVSVYQIVAMLTMISGIYFVMKTSMRKN